MPKAEFALIEATFINAAARSMAFRDASLEAAVGTACCDPETVAAWLVDLRMHEILSAVWRLRESVGLPMTHPRGTDWRALEKLLLTYLPVPADPLHHPVDWAELLARDADPLNLMPELPPSLRPAWLSLPMDIRKVVSQALTDVQREKSLLLRRTERIPTEGVMEVSRVRVEKASSDGLCRVTEVRHKTHQLVPPAVHSGCPQALWSALAKAIDDREEAEFRIADLKVSDRGCRTTFVSLCDKGEDGVQVQVRQRFVTSGASGFVTQHAPLSVGGVISFAVDGAMDDEGVEARQRRLLPALLAAASGGALAPFFDQHRPQDEDTWARLATDFVRRNHQLDDVTLIFRLWKTTPSALAPRHH